MTLSCNGDGPFEHPDYVRASATHEGSEVVVVSEGPARLTLLRSANGEMHTVYGYPHPVGHVSDDNLAALAGKLSRIDAPLRIALSPIGCGAGLARNLTGRIPIASERLICLADLEGDPFAAFGAKARSKVQRALRKGVATTIGPVTADFGMLYRKAMDVHGADPLYRFDDSYFSALAATGAFQVTGRDAHGLCAAALFLAGGEESSYHLSARRDDPPAEAGCVNLLILEGLRECARLGARVCILGGGLSDDEQDPLLQFKAGMSTRTLRRPTFLREVAGG